VTTSRVIARNTALNLSGQVAPLIVAVVAVPFLIKGLGPDRFGVLALAWALIGYFGLFDLGIGRALTQAASEAIGRRDQRRLQDLSGAALLASFALGCVGTLVIALLTNWLCYRVLNMDAPLRPEAARAFYLLAISLPFVIGTVAFRGLLEAHQHFGLATALRLPYSIFNFAGPLMVLPFSHDLTPVIITLVVGRVLTFAAHVWFCLERYPWLRRVSPHPEAVVPLLRLGGWMTVSSLASTAMVYLDRFLIGATLSMAAVAFYVTPFEVVTKGLFIPAAVLGVFFPVFASTFVQDKRQTASMYDRASRFILLVMAPPMLIAAFFAREGLSLWLGPEYAARSTLVLQLLAVGVLVNSVGQVSVALLQGVGRANVAARVHLVELPVYVALILLLARTFGLPGVALAWTLRVILDTAVMGVLSRRELHGTGVPVLRSLAWLGVAVVLFLAGSIPAAFTTRLLMALILLAAFVAAGWRWLVLPSEREILWAVLRSRMGGRRLAASLSATAATTED
jgi:O-antigen/teichoic acid export membrane protein